MHESDHDRQEEPRWPWTLGGVLSLFLATWATLPTLGGPSYDDIVQRAVAMSFAVILGERSVRHGGPIGFVLGVLALTIFGATLAVLIAAHLT